MYTKTVNIKDILISTNTDDNHTHFAQTK